MIFIIIALSFLVAVPAQSQCTDTVVVESEIQLGPLYDIGGLSSIEVINSPDLKESDSGSALVLASSQEGGVIHFHEGETQRIGSVGEGPQEYRAPSIVRTTANAVYVWDKRLLKLIEYPHGRVAQEHRPFSHSISDFVVKNRMVIAQRTGGVQTDYILAYDLDEDRLVARTGQASFEHVVLSMLEGDGAIDFRDGTIYYVSNAEPAIHTYTLETGRHTRMPIEDSSFGLEVFDGSTVQDINEDQQAAVDFMLTNSRFYKLNALPDGRFLAVLQHGDIEYSNQGLETFTRFLNVHLLDPDGTSLGCERIDLTMEETGNHPILGRTEMGFLLLRTVPTEDGDFTYVVERLEAKQ